MSSAIRVPVSLSAAGTLSGMFSCTTRTSVPPSASVSVVVSVISPRRPGSAVSNSTTSTTCSSGTSPAKWPWYVSVRESDLPVPAGASYVSETRNEPPTRASNSCT